MRKEKQHTIRTSSQQRTALAHLAWTKTGEDDQFSIELNFKARIFFEEPYEFGISSFLLLQVICNGNKEQWKRGYRLLLNEFNIGYSYEHQWLPTCFKFPTHGRHLKSCPKRSRCPLQPICSPGLLGRRVWHLPVADLSSSCLQRWTPSVHLELLSTDLLMGLEEEWKKERFW